MAAVIFMGGLIVIGTTVLLITVAHRLSQPRPHAVAHAALPPVAAMTVLTTTMLHEPDGAHIQSVTPTQDGLAVVVTGGGPDRIVLWHAATARAETVLQLQP